MVDYVLRARWIYLNENERREFIAMAPWRWHELATGFMFCKKSGLRDPDLIEDFERMVATIFKYGRPVRFGAKIKMGLNVESDLLWLDEIQNPSDAEIKHKNRRKSK